MIIHAQNERLAAITNAYENQLYGGDFEVRLPDIESWLTSPMFYWSICSNKALPTRLEDIQGSLSILAVSEGDATALLANQIREADLRPWIPSSGERGALYFCSYSLAVAGAGRQQFRLAQDYFAKMTCFDLSPPVMAFSIAATEGGATHLERSGFFAVSGSYLGKYAIYRAGCSHKRQLSRVWAALLRCEMNTNSRSLSPATREFVPA